MLRPLLSIILLPLVLAIILVLAYISRRQPMLQVIRNTIQVRLPQTGNTKATLPSETVNEIPLVEYPETQPKRSLARKVAWKLGLRSSKLDKRQTSSPANQTCSICAEDFVKNVQVRKLPCEHVFHPSCIDQWLFEFAVTCPLW